ncbi:MAG TPA: cold shock domain-containing protein [Thermoanaerobaculia bacterium]|jgi:CspA family cold shock protein
MNQRGTVKWFNNAKGYGFIEPDGGGADVFVHHTAIQMEGFRTLTQGEEVSYEAAEGPKGLQARNVSRA